MSDDFSEPDSSRLIDRALEEVGPEAILLPLSNELDTSIWRCTHGHAGKVVVSDGLDADRLLSLVLAGQSSQRRALAATVQTSL